MDVDDCWWWNMTLLLLALSVTQTLATWSPSMPITLRNWSIINLILWPLCLLSPKYWTKGTILTSSMEAFIRWHVSDKKESRARDLHMSEVKATPGRPPSSWATEMRIEKTSTFRIKLLSVTCLETVTRDLTLRRNFPLGQMASSKIPSLSQAKKLIPVSLTNLTTESSHLACSLGSGLLLMPTWLLFV